MTRIPKIIHFCWFGGGEKQQFIKECIESWKKILPDFDFMEWNERNFSIEESNDYVKEAYYSGKWAFVSDYVRLYALYTVGGVYLDTDVILFKRFDEFLSYKGVFSFESKDYVATCFMASEPNNPFIYKFLQEYANLHFVDSKGKLNVDLTNVKILTRLLIKEGLVPNGKTQIFNQLIVLEQKYFSSNDFRNVFGFYKNSSYGYHLAGASWKNRKLGQWKTSRLRRYLVGVARNWIGTDNLLKIKLSVLYKLMR